LEREFGVPVKEEPGLEQEENESVEKKSKERKPRLISRMPYAPQLGATPDFCALFSDPPTIATPLPSATHYEADAECCVAKAVRDRIYSLSVHSHTSSVVACAGTKTGELVFWDCTREANREWREGDAPRLFIFAPHSEAVSNLKFRPNHANKLLTTSYDGSCLEMDLAVASPAFSPWFQMDSKESVVTGFDVHHDVAYHTDTAGVLRMSDLRTGQKAVQELRLHEAKIGGVSVSSDANRLATCSNDRSIAVWDNRRLDENVEPVCRFEYKNAVTSVAFHPSDPHKLVSTCYDDTVRIHTLHQEPSHHEVVIKHNNQTGRWITLFKAVWDPKSDTSRSIVAIGNM
jgi:WD40 repeat protein